MAKITIAMYDEFEQACQVIARLERNGIPSEQISLVAKDPLGDLARSIAREEQRDAQGGLKGILFGEGAMTIPDVGPTLVSGPLSVALANSGSASAAGSLVEMLVKLGIDPDRAELYANSVRSRDTLVLVESSAEVVPQVVEVMNNFGPIDLDKRAGAYTGKHWQDINPSAENAPMQEIEEDLPRPHQDIDAGRE